MAEKIREEKKEKQLNDFIEDSLSQADDLINLHEVDDQLKATDVMKEMLEKTEVKPDSVNSDETFNTEIINAPIEKASKIKNYLEKPKSKRQQRMNMHKEMKHEKAYNKRLKKVKDKKSLKINVMIGLLITLGILIVFKYVLNIDMSSILANLMMPSIGLSAVLIILSFVLLFTDKTNGLAEPDPITDYFIINRGKIASRADKTHMSKINTRFIMVTLLKLFNKQELAIVNEKIIYGAMDSHITKDELAILNFMLDHNIITVDEFVEVINEEHPGKQYGILGKKDHLYGGYKEAILKMAKDKHYINQSINKAKLMLRAGAVTFGVIVLALLSKGQGSLEMLSVFSAQALILFTLAHYIHAHSKGANRRISQLRKERKLLQSNKADVYTALIYNFLFKKENKSLKRIQKMYKTGEMPAAEYSKFSETYNGFNHILDLVKLEK